MKNSYHFSLGDSTNGAIGFCARILADSHAEAVKILAESLGAINDEVEIKVDGDAVEYIAVYFNSEAITESDIDEVNGPWAFTMNGL